MYKAHIDVDDDFDVNDYNIPVDNEGYVTGWLVEDCIVGPIIDDDENGFYPEWWVQIDRKTLERVDDPVDKGNILIELPKKMLENIYDWADIGMGLSSGVAQHDDSLIETIHAMNALKQQLIWGGKKQ